MASSLLLRPLMKRSACFPCCQIRIRSQSSSCSICLRNVAGLPSSSFWRDVFHSVTERSLILTLLPVSQDMLCKPSLLAFFFKSTQGRMIQISPFPISSHFLLGSPTSLQIVLKCLSRPLISPPNLKGHLSKCLLSTSLRKAQIASQTQHGNE